MTLDQLRALLAIVDEGTFEAAADVLKVSPSAVSQRIRALEAEVGHVVVHRTVPATPTDAGTALLRMARQIAVIEAETLAALGGGDAAQSVLPLAVNADSLATWFVPVFAAAAGWSDTVLQVRLEDEEHSSELLRRGDVVAAVTAAPRPVTGCRTEPLGFVRYQPVAAPALVERYSRTHERAGSRGSSVDLARMPLLRFGPKDDLQNRFLRVRGIHRLPPSHYIPSSRAYLDAALAGLGWGLVPELQLGTAPAVGSLEILEPGGHVDVPLYWQVWKLGSPRIERLTAAVHRAAAAGLSRPNAGGPDGPGPTGS